MSREAAASPSHDESVPVETLGPLTAIWFEGDIQILGTAESLAALGQRLQRLSGTDAPAADVPRLRVATQGDTDVTAIAVSVVARDDPRLTRRREPKQRTRTDRLFDAGCLILLAVTVCLFLIGLVAIARWMDDV